MDLKKICEMQSKLMGLYRRQQLRNKKLKKIKLELQIFINDAEGDLIENPEDNTFYFRPKRKLPSLSTFE